MNTIENDSMTGILVILGRHTFILYPIIGSEKIDCCLASSGRSLQQKIIKGSNRYVNIEGEFKYKESSKFPYAARVTNIEIYPNEDELPTLLDLHGVSPTNSCRLTSEDFVRRQRNNEW